MLSPMFSPLASDAPRLAASIMPGPPPCADNKTTAGAFQVFLPLRHLTCQFLSVFVIPRRIQGLFGHSHVAVGVFGSFGVF